MKDPYSFSDCAGRRVLVVGLGGGCDIISAYALARWLMSCRPKQVVYGNTKKTEDQSVDLLSPHIGRFPGPPEPLRPSVRTHGTALIDRSIPRGNDGCPLIFLLPRRETEDRELREEIKGLGYDLLIGVDTGGDSLAEMASHGRYGRDLRMLRVLQSTELPVTHVVIAPGSDGEGSYERLAGCLSQQEKRGRFQGSFGLEPMIPILKRFAASLPPTRTPNIITAAFEGRLTSAGLSGYVEVPRGIRPVVPLDWLTRGFVFSRK